MTTYTDRLSRISSDRGSGVTIFAFFVMFVIALSGIFIMEINKNLYLQNDYTQIAQRSVQNGLKSQNSIGGLTPRAATSAIEEYLTQRNSHMLTNKDTGALISRSDTVAFRSICGKKSTKYPRFTIQFSNFRKGGWGKEYIYSGGESGRWETVSPEADSAAFSVNEYRSIRMKVEDIGDNYVMSMLGKQCNFFTTTATATSIHADAGSTGN